MTDPALRFTHWLYNDFFLNSSKKSYPKWLHWKQLTAHYWLSLCSITNKVNRFRATFEWINDSTLILGWTIPLRNDHWNVHIVEMWMTPFPEADPNIFLSDNSHMNSIRSPPRTARLCLVSSVSWLSLTHGIASSTSARAGRPSREAETIRARDVWM